MSPGPALEPSSFRPTRRGTATMHVRRRNGHRPRYGHRTRDRLMSACQVCDCLKCRCPECGRLKRKRPEFGRLKYEHRQDECPEYERRAALERLDHFLHHANATQSCVRRRGEHRRPSAPWIPGSLPGCGACLCRTGRRSRHACPADAQRLRQLPRHGGFPCGRRSWHPLQMNGRCAHRARPVHPIWSRRYVCRAMRHLRVRWYDRYGRPHPVCVELA